MMEVLHSDCPKQVIEDRIAVPIDLQPIPLSFSSPTNPFPIAASRISTTRRNPQIDGHFVHKYRFIDHLSIIGCKLSSLNIFWEVYWEDPQPVGAKKDGLREYF